MLIMSIHLLSYRSKSCSVDTILDPKIHSYENVMSDHEVPDRSFGVNQTSIKKPMPAPRNAHQRPEDLIVEQRPEMRMEQRRRHNYEKVDPSKVKGNDNPLSLKYAELDTP